MKKYLLFFLFALTTALYAQKNYPVPAGSVSRLFFIQHNHNHNTFVYDACFSKPGKLLNSKPVDIYRIMYTEGGVKKELTFMQRKMAYGLDIEKINENSYQLCLVAYPKQKLYLRLDKTGKAFIETTVNGKKMILNRMFLQSKPGNSILNTELEYILFYGKDIYGKEVVEKFFP